MTAAQNRACQDALKWYFSGTYTESEARMSRYVEARCSDLHSQPIVLAYACGLLAALRARKPSQPTGKRKARVSANTKTKRN